LVIAVGVNRSSWRACFDDSADRQFAPYESLAKLVDARNFVRADSIHESLAVDQPILEFE
jgi:hypothetical protein